MRVVEWAERTRDGRDGGLVSGDGLHLTDAGRQELVTMISGALGRAPAGSEGECLPTGFTDDSAGPVDGPSGGSSTGSGSGTGTGGGSGSGGSSGSGSGGGRSGGGSPTTRPQHHGASTDGAASDGAAAGGTRAVAPADGTDRNRGDAGPVADPALIRIPVGMDPAP